jgi:hypothetical protein
LPVLELRGQRNAMNGIALENAIMVLMVQFFIGCGENKSSKTFTMIGSEKAAHPAKMSWTVRSVNALSIV